MKKNVTIDTYNSKASDFASYFDSYGARKGDVDKVFNLISKKDPFVVELGCGNGRDAGYILTKTNKYLGMDASQSLIEIATKNNPRADFVVSDFKDFEFPKGMDIVFAFASLLHADKNTFLKVLKNAHKKLNLDGLFYLSLKRRDNYEELNKKDRFGERNFYFYSLGNIEKMIDGLYGIIEYEQKKHADDEWLEVILEKK
jgi:SAM-dependent methyltransferase